MNLYDYQDLKYREFQRKLIVSRYPLIGVRIPQLRKLSKLYNVELFKEAFKLETYEEVMLYGMVIGKEKDNSKRVTLIEEYLEYIDCWSICDSFCSNLTFIKKAKDEYFSWLLTFLQHEKEFYVRFSLVCFLRYYKEEKYIEEIVSKLKDIKIKAYYVDMAIAWMLCEFYIVSEKRISNIIDTLDEDVQKMFNRKVKDSYRTKK